MNYFYLTLIIISMIGIFSQQKFMDIIFSFKVMTISIIAYIWEENLISEAQAYVGFITLYCLYMLLITLKLPKENGQEEEIDRV